MMFILHIGTGKTGSTAIQNYLRKSRKFLLEKNHCYWGLNLEYAPSAEKYEWQRPGGTAVLQRMHLDKAISELTDAFDTSLVNSEPTSTVIMSNESIYEMITLYKPILESLRLKYNLDLKIIAYARSIPSYIVSAYKQWGVKHKTYQGAVKPFDEWVQEQKTFLSYPSLLGLWQQSFANELIVYNYDPIHNVIDHFIDENNIPGCSISAPSLKSKNNSSPGNVELALYALYNNQFSGSVLPTRMKEFLGDYNIQDLQPKMAKLSSLFPSIESLSSLSQFIYEQTSAINAILSCYEQPLFQNADLGHYEARPSESEITNSILSILLKIIVQQDDKIKKLEYLLDSHE